MVFKKRRKGQSDNPSGKPKGSRNSRGFMLSGSVRSCLKRPIAPVAVSEDGNEIALPMAQAVFRSLAAAAAKAEARAQAMFLKLVSASEVKEAAIGQMLDEAR